MTPVRINTSKEREGESFLALTKVGPLKCLPDHVYLVSDQQLRHLRELDVPYEGVPHDEVVEKATRAFPF